MSDTPTQDKQPVASEPKQKDVEHTDAGSAAHKRAAHKRTRRHTAVWFLLIVIVLLAAAGAYAARFILESRDALTAQIESLQQQQQSLLARLQQTEQTASSRLLALQKQQDVISGYIDALRDRDKHLRKDWLVLEAEYLIQLANYRLLFERDINTAIVALNAADARLKDAGDPALLNVRKAIAASVQALKQIDQVDLAGLSLTLTAVNHDMDKLPLNTPDPIARANASQADLSETRHVSSWEELPAAMWHDIKNLIVIRDHDQPVAPLLSPQERFFLVENLHLQIEQARLALLSGQSAVYQERLATAIGWIETHFDKDAAITISTLETLKQLKAANIAPELPDITAAYEALQKNRSAAAPQAKPAAPAETDGTN